MPRSLESICSTVFVLAFVAALAHALWAVQVGWDNYLLDGHGFRQTQTALSAWRMLEGGPLLAYETPVLGAPWSIPFEFPLYQWIVVALVHATALPLEEAGRLVSTGFFFASLVPVALILRELAVSRSAICATLALILCSPTYLFWSRTFLIESTALFLGLTFLYAVLRWQRASSKRALILALATGALGALVKVTTFAGFLLPAGALLAAARLRHRRNRNLPLDAVVLLLPVLLTKAWVAYSDALKTQNAFAAEFLTSAALADWNFGAWQLRLEPSVWGDLLQRVTRSALGQPWLVVLGLVMLLPGSRHRWPFVAAVACFLAVPAIFLNLHFVHDYYWYANSIFLCTAMGLAIASLALGPPPARVASVVVLGIALSAGLAQYHRDYLLHQRQNAGSDVVEVGRMVAAHTTPGDVVFIVGADWSSTIPFYAKRRAIMDHADGGRPSRGPGDPLFERTLAATGEVAAMLVCGASRLQPDFTAPRIERLRLRKPVAARAQDCDLYGKGRD